MCVCVCVELWRARSWGSSTSLHLFLQKTRHWFTPRLVSPGLDAALTTSSTGRAPFLSTAKQYVPVFSPLTWFYHIWLLMWKCTTWYQKCFVLAKEVDSAKKTLKCYLFSTCGHQVLYLLSVKIQEIEEMTFITQLAGLTDHIPVGLRLNITMDFDTADD